MRLSTFTLFLVVPCVRAFASRSSCSTQRLQRQSVTSSVSCAVKKSPSGDFEYQEMKVQLEAMKKAGVQSGNLELTKRAELAAYVEQVAKIRQSPIELSHISPELPGSSWRIAFSTESATLGDLPRDATVFLNFIDETNLDYTLQFTEKTFGLNSIKAKSKWTCSNRGVVTFVYDKITTDIFGLENVGVGFFGLLKGRSNYVESIYFDGTYWIERGYTPSGESFWNVYVREA